MVYFCCTKQSVNWTVKLRQTSDTCLELNTAVNKPQPYRTAAYRRSLNLFVNRAFQAVSVFRLQFGALDNRCSQ